MFFTGTITYSCRFNTMSIHERSVTYSIMTGLGTIDRMKSGDTLPDEAPTQLEDVFGIGLRIAWLLPTDPLFADFDRVLGYSMPQRLLREGGDQNSIC
jgi:hypothetical protein